MENQTFELERALEYEKELMVKEEATSHLTFKAGG